MSERPKVTIGVPAYNGERHIGQAIESLLNQDFPDFELILSDNGSNDGTGKICLDYQQKDKRIKYYRYERNVGLIRNFNRVFEMSSGQYFMWASCDDTWEKDYISSCMEVLEGDPSVVLCYSATNLVNDDGSLIRQYDDKFLVDHDSGSQRYLNLIWGLDLCNCLHGLIRSSALSCTRLMQDNVGASDCVLLAELALKGKFIQLQKPMFNRKRLQRIETLEQRHARLESMCSPHILNKGISLPFCNMIKAHVDVIKHSSLDMSEKNDLIPETYRCMMARYKQQIQFEVQRAVKLIIMGLFQQCWGKPTESRNSSPGYKAVEQAYICDLLASMNYALFLLPHYPGLHYARAVLLIELGRLEEARLALSQEMERHPDIAAARTLFQRLDTYLRERRANG